MPSKYDPETRAKAVRLVLEHRDDYPSEWAAITAVSKRLAMNAETLRNWIRQQQVDDVARDWVSSEAAAEIRALRRRNAELTSCHRGRSQIRVILRARRNVRLCQLLRGTSCRPGFCHVTGQRRNRAEWALGSVIAVTSRVRCWHKSFQRELTVSCGAAATRSAGRVL